MGVRERFSAKHHTLTNMHKVGHELSDLDAAPITADEELGAIGDLSSGRPEPASHRAHSEPARGTVLGRLGHVPEHEASQSSGSWLGRTTVLLVGVFLVGTAFIAFYVGALHQPQPKAVPVGVVSGDIGAQALLTQIRHGTDQLDAKVYPTAGDADRALAARRIYAILDTDLATEGLRVTLAGGAAPGVADLVTQVVSTAAGAARIPLSVRDVHPPAAKDPRGLTPFYLVVGWLLGGYLAATALAVILGTVPRGAVRLGMRLGAFAAFAVLFGLAGALITGPVYGIWSAHFAVLWLVGALVVFAGASITAALESWVGLVGTGVAMLLLFILGNPGSGGIYPPEFLPGFFRGMHGWLPTGIATELVRAVEYFGGDTTGWLAAKLVLWTVLGLATVLTATLALGRRQSGGTDR